MVKARPRPILLPRSEDYRSMFAICYVAYATVLRGGPRNLFHSKRQLSMQKVASNIFINDKYSGTEKNPDMAKTQTFSGTDVDLERLATRIETYLQENKFEMAFSKDSSEPASWFFIQ